MASSMALRQRMRFLLRPYLALHNKAKYRAPPVSAACLSRAPRRRHRTAGAFLVSSLVSPLDYLQESRQAIEEKLADLEEEQRITTATEHTAFPLSQGASLHFSDSPFSGTNEQQMFLWQQQERSLANELALRVLGEDPVLVRFYRIVQLKLEGLWIATKLLSVQVLRAEAGEDHALDELQEISLVCCGTSVSFISGGASVGNTSESLPQGQNLLLKQANYWQTLGSLKSLLKAAEQTARSLTQQFGTYIKALPTDTALPEPLITLLLKSQRLSIQEDTLEKFADVVVLRIWVALKRQKLMPKSLTGLVRQCVAYGSGAVTQELDEAKNVGGEKLGKANADLSSQEMDNYADLNLPKTCIEALHDPKYPTVQLVSSAFVRQTDVSVALPRFSQSFTPHTSFWQSGTAKNVESEVNVTTTVNTTISTTTSVIATTAPATEVLSVAPESPFVIGIKQ